ncbi:g11743, partial [Coccomyxa viridis]
MAHFVPTNDTVSAQEFAAVFRDQVWKHHGLCKDMVSDRDPRFTSKFWTEVVEDGKVPSAKHFTTTFSTSI